MRDAPWMPSHYVTQSALDRHLDAMRRRGTIVHLRDVLPELRPGRGWREPLYAVTFDDAPANLIPLALPVLDAYGVRGTIFAVTDLLDDGGILPNDRRRMAGAGSPQPELLRHMTWDEADVVVRSGHWLGAHTRTHAILSHAGEAARRDEIAGSIEAIRSRYGTDDVPFAFPNGLAGDFDESDISLLRELHVPLACTGIAGANRPPVDLLRLRRNAVGLHHGRAAFSAEMWGLRDWRHVEQPKVAACT